MTSGDSTKMVRIRLSERQGEVFRKFRAWLAGPGARYASGLGLQYESDPYYLWVPMPLATEPSNTSTASYLRLCLLQYGSSVGVDPNDATVIQNLRNKLLCVIDGRPMPSRPKDTKSTRHHLMRHRYHQSAFLGARYSITKDEWIALFRFMTFMLARERGFEGLRQDNDKLAALAEEVLRLQVLCGDTKNKGRFPTETVAVTKEEASSKIWDAFGALALPARQRVRAKKR